jgi:hypothetical protein
LERIAHNPGEALDLAERSLRSIWDHLTRFGDGQRSQKPLLIRTRDGRRLNPVWYRVVPIGDSDKLYRCNTCNRVEAVSVRNVCPWRGCGGNHVLITSKEIADNHYRVLYAGEIKKELVVEEHTAQLTTERSREVQRRFQNGHIHVLSCSTTFELGVDLCDLNTVFLRNVPPEPFNYVQRVGRAGRRAGSPGFAVTYCRRGPHDLYHFADPSRLLSGRTNCPSVSLSNKRMAERHLTAIVLSEFFRHNQTRFDKVDDLIEN